MHTLLVWVAVVVSCLAVWALVMLAIWVLA